MNATATKKKNPLLELLDYGQSVWYDYIRHGLITSGELERLITLDGLRESDVEPVDLGEGDQRLDRLTRPRSPLSTARASATTA